MSKGASSHSSAENATWETFRLLTVSPGLDDHLSLQRILDADQCRIDNVSSWREAVGYLRNSGPAVVVCESQLPDGSWKDLLRALRALKNPPPMIVMSWHADEALWAEVLNLGGYDVLMKPFDGQEVSRVTRMAWLHWQRGGSNHALSARSVA